MMKKKKEDLPAGDGDSALIPGLDITVSNQDEVHFVWGSEWYKVERRHLASGVVVYRNKMLIGLCDGIPEVFDLIYFDGDEKQKDRLTGALRLLFQSKDGDGDGSFAVITGTNDGSTMSWDQYRDKYNMCLRKLLGDPVGTGELAAIGLEYNGFELEGAINTLLAHCRWSHNNRIEIYDHVRALCKAGGLRMSVSLVDSISGLVGFYHKESVRSTEARVRLESDMLGYLQGVCMVIEGIGMAATHREKEARVRGALDVVNVMVRRLRDVRGGGYLDGLFSGYLGSDYAFRDILRENREMKAELARLRGDVVVDSEDHLF